MRPIVLTILDGWGYSPQKIGNAIASARTPVFDSINSNYPITLLQASGQAVGMTWGESGNSEVGHLSLGAGRIIFQYLSRINKDISAGKFAANPALKKIADHISKYDSTLHIAGLLTSGSVHAYFSHLLALIDFAKINNLKKINIHLFTDGRDSGLKEAPILIKKLQDYLSKNEVGHIATIIGRNFAMDRNNNWGKTETAFNLITNNTGNQSDDVLQTLETYYSQGIIDSDVPATFIDPENKLNNGDALIFFNFREDSMRQITRSFVEKDFKEFNRQLPEDILVSAMTEYIENPDLNVLYPPPDIKNSLSEVVSQNNYKQFHIAETEKYAHVTFFFNGLHNKPFEGETDLFIKSKEDTLHHPEMQTEEITDKVIEALQNDEYEFYVINLANGDLLAHLGNLDATIKGVETIDTAIGRLKETVLEKDGVMIITADHGNAESLVYKSTGEHETRHNDNPIPFYLIGREFERQATSEEIASSFSEVRGILADVAPTILELMNIPKPNEMNGESLLPYLIPKQ